MLLGGIQGDFGLDPRLKRSGVTSLDFERRFHLLWASKAHDTLRGGVRRGFDMLQEFARPAQVLMCGALKPTWFERFERLELLERFERVSFLARRQPEHLLEELDRLRHLFVLHILNNFFKAFDQPWRVRLDVNARGNPI